MQQTERDELVASWRALAGTTGGAEGWRTIGLSASATRFLAGRRFPENEEALLVGFKSIPVPSPEHLPQGQGFAVLAIELGWAAQDKVWFALSRRAEGTIEIFTMMAVDVMAVLLGSNAVDESVLFYIFIARIRAWQQFMSRGANANLRPEEELGLVGEIQFLRDLSDAGFPPASSVAAWMGPMDGLQDFFIETGAIEVKTSLASKGFRAKISSLDQLDSSERQPLFLAAVRMSLDESGLTLPTMVGDMRAYLAIDNPAVRSFNDKLIRAGYFDAATEHYKRSFTHTATKILQVDEGFPCLTRRNVSAQITEAYYEINIDDIDAKDIGFASMLKLLGVI